MATVTSLKPGTANMGGLEKHTLGKDAMKWIATAKVVLNGTQVDVPIPDGASHVLLECVKQMPDGPRYNIVFYQVPPGTQSYLEFGGGKVPIYPGRIYQLPPDARQLRLGMQ